MEAVQNPYTVVIEVSDDSDGGNREKDLVGGGGGAGGVGACRSCDSDSGNRSGGGEEEEEAEEDDKECTAAEIVKERRSSASERSVEVDLEHGIPEVHLSKSERDCRICHMSLDIANQESGVPFELGCSCKDDLAAAHKHCAETWFKIKGNKICEVCGSIAHNVSGVNEAEPMEHWDEANDTTQQASAASAPTHVAEARNFWQGHRFLNFLLACMVFAFVISWLFHFNVPS